MKIRIKNYNLNKKPYSLNRAFNYSNNSCIELLEPSKSLDKIFSLWVMKISIKPNKKEAR